MKKIDPLKNYRYKSEIYSGRAILLARKYRKRDGLSLSAALIKAETVIQRKFDRDMEKRRDQMREYQAWIERKDQKSQANELGHANLDDLDEIEWMVKNTSVCLDCVGKRFEVGDFVRYRHSPTCPSAITHSPADRS